MEYLNKFSKSKIDEIVNEDDLNEAMCLAQDNIGVKSGDVCGVYFSKFKDADEEWEQASTKERTNMLKEYLSLEDSYKMSGGGDVYDDFDSTIIEINRTAKMLFNRLRGPLKLSDKDYTPGNHNLDAEIKIATKKFINVGPDGAYITEIHSNGTMSFSEPTSDLQKVISEVLEKKMSGGGNVPKKEKLASIVDKAFSDTTERIGQDNLKSGFYEWTSPKWIEGNVMTTSVDPTWVWADEDEDGEGIDGYWSISKEDVKKATDKLDTALKGQISKSSVIKKKSSGETWYDGDEEIEHFNYQVITTFKSAKGKKMSGGGNVPKGVMTLKEWIENTDLDEVGKYVKSKLKKPETQIYVIGEEDDYAVTIDTDWKEDKPLTDEEGSEHTLFIGKGVVEIDTDGAFTNTFFTKDANSTITKKYDEMSGGGYVTDWNGTKVTISKGDDPSRDITMLMEMSDTFGGLDIALSRLTKTYPIKSIKIDLKD